MTTNNVSDKYLGLTKKAAQNLAEGSNLIFRLVRIDKEEFLGYPKDDDKRDDRICVEIDGGKVSKAVIQ